MPNETSIEQMVLGSLLIEKNAVDKVANILRPEHFYDGSNSKIYSVILEMSNRNIPIDIYTVTEQLRHKGLLEDVGGAYYIATLPDKVGSAAHIEYHARIIVEKAIRREIVKCADNLQLDGINEAVPMDELIRLLEQTTQSIQESVVKQDAENISSILPDVLKKMEEVSSNPDELSGVSSGFSSIDRITQGWQRSDMIVIAARPSMGKTAFSVSMAVNMAKQGKNVLFFSLEMSKAQIVQRILSMETGVNQNSIRRGLSTDEWSAVDSKVQTISNLNIIIDDEAAISVLDFKTKSRQYMKQYSIDIIMIDYLQLMVGDNKNNRNEEVRTISSGIKAIAKELNIPVIALSQLNRAVESRAGDKRPMLSDLRDSGSIEQDADIVCFIHRPEKYGIEVTEDGEPTENLGQIIFAKNRNGEIGDVNLKFNGEQVKFEEWE